MWRVLAAAVVCFYGATASHIPETQHECTFNDIVATEELLWCPCEGGFSCAKLDVPLDYLDPELGRASIALIKYAAKPNSADGPYKGMVLINPGGPGGSGVNSVMTQYEFFHNRTGTNYDIVGFDPRGMYRSSPAVDCTGNATAVEKRTEVPKLLDSYYENFIAQGYEQGSRCQAISGGPKQAGPHMATAAVCKDMISIVDAFAKTCDGQSAEDSHLVNFYGLSYGTYLGQMFASIFPERVGHLVVDGVIQPESYQGVIGVRNLNSLDSVIGSYFVYCYEAGEEACPFFTGTSPKCIFERFQKSFTRLNPRQAVAENWQNATLLEDALISLKSRMRSLAYYPIQTFPNYTDIFLTLEMSLQANDLAGWVRDANAEADAAPPDPHPEYYNSVICPDSNLTIYNKTLEELRPQLNVLESLSVVGEAWAPIGLTCAGWSISNTDIFLGPYGGDTATPILFVNPTHDGTSPLINAEEGATKYKDAGVLAVDAIGHCTTTSENDCAHRKVRAYFQETQIPDSGCPLELGPFGIQLNGTIQENLDKAGLSSLFI